MLTKAVTDDDIIGENIIVDFPAETGVIFHKCFDVFKALFVFGVPLDRTNAISGLVDSHYQTKAGKAHGFNRGMIGRTLELLWEKFQNNFVYIHVFVTTWHLKYDIIDI